MYGKKTSWEDISSITYPCFRRTDATKTWWFNEDSVININGSILSSLCGPFRASLRWGKWEGGRQKNAANNTTMKSNEFVLFVPAY